MRVLWVVPRFGEAVVGGAETLVRELATRALPDGWTSEVATTCAVDHETWENALSPGTRTEAGVTVHRFPVGDRDPSRYEQLHPLMLNGTARYGEQVEWLAHSVWSPNLDAFLDKRGLEYDLIVLAPYLFGVTVWGVFVHPDRSALLPCLHDEGYARLEPVRQAFAAARGCLFNTAAEARLAASLYDVRAGAEVGIGFDPPDGPPEAGFAEARGLGDFVLYAGRLEEGKRVDVAVEYAVRYASERREAPRLVLAGHGSYRPPEWARDVVVEVGALEGEERRAARCRGALARRAVGAREPLDRPPGDLARGDASARRWGVRRAQRALRRVRGRLRLRHVRGVPRRARPAARRSRTPERAGRGGARLRDGEIQLAGRPRAVRGGG